MKVSCYTCPPSSLHFNLLVKHRPRILFSEDECHDGSKFRLCRIEDALFTHFYAKTNVEVLRRINSIEMHDGLVFLLGDG